MSIKSWTKNHALKRFWASVDKSGPVHPALGRCWVWVRGGGRRYGSVMDHGLLQGAHRFSWAIHNGEVPSGMHVLHKCDNKRCVRPSHLFLGTAVANNADRDAKGRQAKGERNWNAKLTAGAVASMRRRYRRYGKTNNLPSLAREFGVSVQAAHMAIFRKTWRHVP